MCASILECGRPLCRFRTAQPLQTGMNQSLMSETSKAPFHEADCICDPGAEYSAVGQLAGWSLGTTMKLLSLIYGPTLALTLLCSAGVTRAADAKTYQVTGPVLAVTP